ncbi:MAG: FAD-dependent oxidoreductase, partial [Chloroflexi bacterium]|nr:FAD-dependent oxidoreductase [Chloroflexota bacterium]
MTDRFDLVVIGAGSAGLSAASFAARIGARVALVERDRIGGDCTWRGCVPSKALLRIAGVAHAMRRADAFGLPLLGQSVDLAQVMAEVRRAVERVYQFETPAVLAKQGITVIQGPARFLDPHRLAVDGQTLAGRRFVISTGARPVIPPVPGLAETPHLTYETVFALSELPRRLLVLGAGPVGVELAQAFRRLGSQVVLIEQADRVLPVADPDASAALGEQLASEGIRLQLGAAVERIEARDGAVRAIVGADTCIGDALLVVTGRRPNVAGLDLERAGVMHSASGIPVDDHLQTNRRHVYAAGDVTGAVQLTHYAGWQGVVAARNALLPGAARGTRPTVPWVVFTDPEVGQVGLGEREARARGERVVVHRWPIERIDRAQTAGERTGFLKLVARPNGILTGATVVGSAAGELINELALAVDRRLTLADLAATIHAYPTYGFAIQQASAEAT